MLIAIIAAMEEENASLRIQLKNIKTEIMHGFEFCCGTIYGKDVVLLKSGVGKVNAAISTTLLLHQYKPDYVINTGTAGGFDPSLNIGDLVISENVLHHDVNVTSFGYEAGQLPGLPTLFSPDKQLLAITIKQLDALDIPYRQGLIASGDRFIHEGNDVNTIRRLFPDMMACEMEAAAVAQVCYKFKIPFIVIRAISDIPGKENVRDFKIFLKTSTQTYTRLLIEMLRNI